MVRRTCLVELALANAAEGGSHSSTVLHSTSANLARIAIIIRLRRLLHMLKIALFVRSLLSKSVAAACCARIPMSAGVPWRSLGIGASAF